MGMGRVCWVGNDILALFECIYFLVEMIEILSAICQGNINATVMSFFWDTSYKMSISII